MFFFDSNMDYRKYFKDRSCDFWYEYDDAYGWYDWHYKTVTMVGADCGSSSLYFILHGAKYIVAYEKDEDIRKKWDNVCKEFNICEKVEMRGEWIGQYPSTDVFVMDCEGCEHIIDFELLKGYKAVFLAVHDWTEDRVKLLRQMYRWKLVFVSDDGKELMFFNGE